MPHRRVDLLAFARRQPPRRMLHAVILAAITTSCRDARTTTVIVPDTSAGRDSLEVVALPVDPASLRTTTATPEASVGVTLADSASFLDARFQEERTALNSEARSLAGGDRRSAHYGERFDAWRRRALAAESLRTHRDKLRARAGAPRVPNAEGTLRATLLRATSPDGRAVLVRTLASGDSIALDLSRGDWWVGAARPGGVPSRWARANGRRLALEP